MQCIICKKEIKFYGNSKIGRKIKRNKCGACNTKIRRYRAKAAAIKLLGGKCNRCGWVGHQCAFEFHHTDPTKKDFNLGMVGNKSWKSILEEIKKCELLCSNCHRIEHSNRDDEIFLLEALNYRGVQLDIDGIIEKKHYYNIEQQCEYCKKLYYSTHKNQKYCGNQCYILARKQNRPPKEQLIEQVQQFGYKKTSKKYGVSDKTIAKWYKEYLGDIV